MMGKSFVRRLEDFWYEDMYLSPWLVPFSLLFADAVRVRRFLYRKGLLKSVSLPVPVVVVGNITVGGVGKTPLVAYLGELLQHAGYKPGMVSRGYRGTANRNPQLVGVNSDPGLVGDEAVLLARRSACPVAVGVERAAAARLLVAQGCDIIIADDGLQHYALCRDVEIAVIDGNRRFGNGYCLPAGPLREPPERLREVDLLVVNGGNDLQENEFAMRYCGDSLVNLESGERKPLADFKGSRCHAVAAIGNPGRFFAQLAVAGIDCITHAFPDHYAYGEDDLRFQDGLPVLMTEKDAVKCRSFTHASHWYLPVAAELSDEFSHQFFQLLKDRIHG